MPVSEEAVEQARMGIMMFDKKVIGDWMEKLYGGVTGIREKLFRIILSLGLVIATTAVIASFFVRSPLIVFIPLILMIPTANEIREWKTRKNDGLEAEIERLKKRLDDLEKNSKT